ncbi:MAG: hypothetical protein WCY41_05550 [Candidatus Micrarchaeia archaeon]
MSEMQMVSIVLEAIVVFLCLAALFNGKKYMAGFAVTFAVYVLYDLARFTSASIPEMYLEGVFFVATLCALFSAWQIYSNEGMKTAAAKKKK